MKFVRSLNNSAAIVLGDNGKEEVVLGKGIGFGNKSGDTIDISKIEHRFVMAENKINIDQIKEIRATTFDITDKVIDLVERKLQIKFDDFQYLALADHIDFALTRVKDHIDVSDNNTRWETRNLFPKEYEVAKKIVNLINQKANVQLPDSESVFMTYHLVNASYKDTQIQETIKLTQLIAGVVNIIQLEYQVVLDTDSFNYNRFITHIRALMVRFMKKQKSEVNNLDPSLLELMKVKYNHAYETAQRISIFLHKKMGWVLKQDDLFYLTLHIWRVTSRQDQYN